MRLGTPEIQWGKRLFQADLGNADRMCARAVREAVPDELDPSLAWH